MKTETVKGFSDYTGEEALKKLQVKKILEKEFLKYGFEPAETPIVEYEEFVKGDKESQNDEAVSDIFKLEDKGKRKLALRYELTFPLKRIMKQQKLPYKRFQIGAVFRDEPISGNRFRQFTQADIDIIGSNLKDTAEILAITSKVMKELKIDAEIFFNNRKLLNEIMEEQKIDEKYRADVIREIDKLDKLSEKEVADNLKKYKAEKIIKIIKQPEEKFEKYSFYKQIKELKKYCKDFGLNIKFIPSLARGLSYYNETVFEVRTKEIKETVTAGGAFMFNNIQCVGISFGLERLALLTKIKPETTKAIIISLGKDKESIALAEKLRNENISTQLLMDKSPSKALEYANSKKIKFAIFIGNEEIKNKKFKLKNLETGEEKLIEEKSIIKELS
jgi:histidyl-tRNA synthetase